MIIGISEFGFFCPKMAVSWRITSFQKKKQAETPIFVVFLGARFLGQGVKKRQFLDTLSKRKKFWLIIEKLFFFLVFLCCLLYLSWFFFFCFFCCFLFCYFCFFLFFFGGFKGQVRWPKGPPHLALNHPYFFVFVFCCFFCFFWRV